MIQPQHHPSRPYQRPAGPVVTRPWDRVGGFMAGVAIALVTWFGFVWLSLVGLLVNLALAGVCLLTAARPGRSDTGRRVLTAAAAGLVLMPFCLALVSLLVAWGD